MLNEDDIDKIIESKYSDKSEKTKKFIKKLELNFPGRDYDYSEVDYVNNRELVKIYCNKHNHYFFISPSNALAGKQGCKFCRKENKIEYLMKINKPKFLNFLSEYFPNLEILNPNDYCGQFVPYHFRCKIHNIEFDKTQRIIVRDRNEGREPCPLCNNSKIHDERYQLLKLNFEKNWGDVYDISKLEFDLIDGPGFNIKCNKCGNYFNVSKIGSLSRAHTIGCDCQKSVSIGERLVMSWLKDHNILFDNQQSLPGSLILGRNGNGVNIDFILKGEFSNFWIECNGEQHYTLLPGFLGREADSVDKFNLQIKRDEQVRQYCRENKILLIEIPFNYYHRPSQVTILLNEILLNKNYSYSGEIPEVNIKRDCILKNKTIKPFITSL